MKLFFKNCLIATLIFISAKSFALDKHVVLSDRLMIEPTGWFHAVNASPDYIKSKIKEGLRLIDLEITEENPIRFSAVFVSNSGNYEKGWWWYYDLSANALKENLDNLKARIVDLEVNSNGLYTVILEPNTGENAKAWWYYPKISAENLKEKLAENAARIVDIDPFPKSNNYFSVVMVKNSGIDNSGWWYYTDLPKNQILDKIKQHNARIVDMEKKPNGNFILVMLPYQNEGWNFFAEDVPIYDLSRYVSDRKLRLVDFEVFKKNDKFYFNAVALQNLQPGETIPPIGPRVLDFNKYPLKKEPVTGLDFPENMPAIHWPSEYKNCDAADRQEVQEGWAKGHYYTWRAKQLLDFIASEPAEKRSTLWNKGFDYDQCKISLNCWTPRAWFGPYDSDRFKKIRGAITKVFSDRFLGEKYNMKLRCRADCDDSTNAYHIVVGYVNFCPNFFVFPKTEKGRIVTHELLHGMTVSYDGRVIQDTHIFCHKDSGLCKCPTEKFYGPVKAFQLANTPACVFKNFNYEKALINNDNYAQFAKILGMNIDNGDLKKFSSY